MRRSAVFRRLLLFPVMTCTGLFHPLIAWAQEDFLQEGMASYYGKEFHGERTANGETYSMWQLTAAHPTLPFNTLLRVTNLSNNRSVVVRVNDAGPFKRGRIIDLSRQAALELDMIREGTARVRVEKVGRAEPRADAMEGGDYLPIEKEIKQPGGFGIQVGSYADTQNLQRKLAELRSKGEVDIFIQSAIRRGKTYQRVVIGGFSSRESAEDYVLKLRQKGIEGFVFQVR